MPQIIFLCGTLSFYPRPPYPYNGNQTKLFSTRGGVGGELKRDFAYFSEVRFGLIYACFNLPLNVWIATGMAVFAFAI
jgi:hypothetical protein